MRETRENRVLSRNCECRLVMAAKSGTQAVESTAQIVAFA